MKDKLNFKFLGMDFNVPGYITDYDHDKRMVIDCVGSGQMVKQYIKQRFSDHDIKVWVKSERYSGGSSLMINLSHKDGSKIQEEVYKDIKSFGNTLQMGTFNGMIDMYEKSDEVYRTNDGVEIEFFTKFVFTYNRPPYGTKEYELQEQLELV
jgi:hypothetical protein